MITKDRFPSEETKEYLKTLRRDCIAIVNDFFDFYTENPAPDSDPMFHAMLVHLMMHKNISHSFEKATAEYIDQLDQRRKDHLK